MEHTIKYTIEEIILLIKKDLFMRTESRATGDGISDNWGMYRGAKYKIDEFVVVVGDIEKKESKSSDYKIPTLDPEI